MAIRSARKCSGRWRRYDVEGQGDWHQRWGVFSTGTPWKRRESHNNVRRAVMSSRSATVAGIVKAVCVAGWGRHYYIVITHLNGDGREISAAEHRAGELQRRTTTSSIGGVECGRARTRSLVTSMCGRLQHLLHKLHLDNSHAFHVGLLLSPMTTDHGSSQLYTAHRSPHQLYAKFYSNHG